MKFKKSQASDAGIILGIIAFQAFIIIALGFLNIKPATQQVGTDFSIVGYDDINFSTNLVTNLTELRWFNTLIFTPLIIIIIYIVAKLIRGGG